MNTVMDDYNRERYLSPQQYFKKINESRRQIQRLQAENAKLRNSLSKFMKFEIALKSSKIETVKSVINQYYTIDIEAKTRDEDYVKGRRIYYVWLKENTSMTLKAMGNSLTLNQDHTTILHALNQHQDYIISNKRYLKEYREVIELIDSVLAINSEKTLK